MDTVSKYALTDYIQAALSQAVFESLEGGFVGARIPPCQGVVAFGAGRKECEQELQSALEDWILVGLKLNHPLPVLAGIDLNKGPKPKPVDTL